jgi:hypothetical protein
MEVKKKSEDKGHHTSTTCFIFPISGNNSVNFHKIGNENEMRIFRAKMMGLYN